MTTFDLRMKYHQETGLPIPKMLTSEYAAWLEMQLTGENLVDKLPIKEVIELENKIEDLEKENKRLENENSSLEREILELT